MASVDPVAQSVEHNTFNVGVPGSSPGGITEEISDNQPIIGDFFVYISADIERLYPKIGLFQAKSYTQNSRGIWIRGLINKDKLCLIVIKNHV